MGSKRKRIVATEDSIPKELKCICNVVCPVNHEMSRFERLKKDLLAKGFLYDDPDFPAVKSSYGSDDFFRGNIDWRRPFELRKDHGQDQRFILEGTTRFDVVQGQIGNCWFASSLAILSSNDGMLHQVLPKGQSLQENWAGIFQFRFWQFGRWVTVIVDDRLPTVNNGKSYLFMTSRDSNEFWSALLEKAYAKLYGSYQALSGGLIGTALEDLTGGLSEYIYTNYYRGKEANLFRIMLQAQRYGSLMGCSTGEISSEATKRYGMIELHAYSITSVKLVDMKNSMGNSKKYMVRVRNPHGTNEWKGDWSDMSSKWIGVPDDVKKSLDLKVRDDGEYWMEIEDFCKHFNSIEIIHLNPALDIDSNTVNKWNSTQFRGKWVDGHSAGGSMEFPDTFHTNPQYRLNLHEPDDTSVGDGDHMCTVMISLKHKSNGKPGNDIGYTRVSIFKITDTGAKLGRFDKSFFEENLRVDLKQFNISSTDKRASSKVYENKRFTLAPGNYCVVPTTLETGKEAEFLLRIFTEKHHTASE